VGDRQATFDRVERHAAKARASNILGSALAFDDGDITDYHVVAERGR